LEPVYVARTRDTVATEGNPLRYEAQGTCLKSRKKGEAMLVRKLMTIAAAASVLAAPVTVAAQAARVQQPVYAEDRNNPAAALIGVILAAVILGVAIKAIGGRDRPLPAPPPPVSP
jgi:hypothetical protein